MHEHVVSVEQSLFLHVLCLRNMLLSSGVKRKYYYNIDMFLGAFAKLRKPTITFVMSVCPSAGNNSAPNGQIFMKFNIDYF